MIILPTNSVKDTGFNIANSLRFNSGSSDYLSRTASAFGTPTNRKKCTISFWCKRSSLTVQQAVMGVRTTPAGGTSEARIVLRGDDTLEFYDYQSGYKFRYITNRVFRDTSAWLHIVFSVDTTHPSGSARVNLYINGVAETSFSSTTDPAQDLDTFLNSGNYVQLGRQSTGNSYYGGYLSEYVFIDGSALAPTSFGEFDEDSGIWKPIDVSGLTFGTNGFYLDFENSGALGADVSGNSNNFTVNNLTSIDQSTDTCTNNFATWNPLILTETVTFSDGNLSMVKGATQYRGTLTTMIVEKGKWYAEIKVTNAVDLQIGFMRADTLQDGARSIYLASSNIYWQDSNSTIAYTLNNGNQGNVTVTGGSNSVSTYTTNDIIMLALDMDNGLAWFGKNGTWENSGNPASGSNAFNLNSDYTNGIGIYAGLNNASVSANFGSPAFAISSGNTDSNGYGNFEYAVPNSYLSLCTANLSEVLG